MQVHAEALLVRLYSQLLSLVMPLHAQGHLHTCGIFMPRGNPHVSCGAADAMLLPHLQ
jgi:hypothetical protein